MANVSRPKRSYNSTRRQAQARLTQMQIVEAAREAFFERGYAGTTIEAIAQAAGVSVETIYASFGSKVGILKKLVDYSVTGDDTPIPLLERPNITVAREATDLRWLLQKFAGNIYDIMTRMSPVFDLLRSASKTEPEIKAIRDQVLKGRMQGMRFMVDQLARMGGLREGLDPAKAAETVWAISSGEVFSLLTRDLGWNREQYVAWLSESLTRLLL